MRASWSPPAWIRARTSSTRSLTWSSAGEP